MKKRTASIILLLLFLVAASTYWLSSRSSKPRICRGQFGDNLSFENGTQQPHSWDIPVPSGWTVPIGTPTVITNLVHSGNHSVLLEARTSSVAELYQNWKVDQGCGIVLEAYLYITCNPVSPQSLTMAGIQLREYASIEFYAYFGVCPDSPVPPPSSQRNDSVHVKSGLGGPYYDWSMPYVFEYDEWYKLGIKVAPDGHVLFFVNDGLVHTENWKPDFSQPSFGARVLPGSMARFDDFTMAEYNP